MSFPHPGERHSFLSDKKCTQIEWFILFLLLLLYFKGINYVFLVWCIIVFFMLKRRVFHCSICHSFPFLFRLPRTWLFMRNSADVSRKAEDVYPTCTPGLCFQVLLVSELLIYVCYFVLFWLIYVLLCVSVFYVWFLYLDYILLMSARILVPLITHYPERKKK